MTLVANATAHGWVALSGGRWEEAQASFEEALADQERPEAFEGLSWAAWWLDDAETVFDARERAFQLYRQRGDASSAWSASTPFTDTSRTSCASSTSRPGRPPPLMRCGPA